MSIRSPLSAASAITTTSLLRIIARPVDTAKNLFTVVGFATTDDPGFEDTPERGMVREDSHVPLGGGKANVFGFHLGNLPLRNTDGDVYRHLPFLLPDRVRAADDLTDLLSDLGLSGFVVGQLQIGEEFFPRCVWRLSMAIIRATCSLASDCR